MNEIGFWDYTCPLHGSLERYTKADWDLLLDDISKGGFNSLVLGIKWLTTGYRSRYPWLDQDQECSAIASDNQIIYHVLREASSRGIKLWLLVVATIFDGRSIDLPYGQQYWTGDFKPYAPYYRNANFKVYDLDAPGLPERMDLLFCEIVELFGAEVNGLIVELEFCDGETEHRITIYDEWALKNNRPKFHQIKNIKLEPRFYPYTHWRDFTTTRRIETLKQIEKTVRSAGFTGKLASIIELDNQPTAVLGNVNMTLLQQGLPHWKVVTYDSIYDRRRNRLATMDLCLHQPRQAGLEPLFLTRGVMTFGIPPDLQPTTLLDQWRMSLEDARLHQAETLWFMGSDCRTDGWVCSPVKLPQWGFLDGRSARLQLMRMAAEMLKH